MSTDLTAGYQSWRNLAFLHWRVDAERLQRQLPDGLTIETFDGSAWIGVVPFSMERVRPWWSPPVPGISWFLETNVRTYVVDRTGRSGVWFFSLDANSRLAVSIARRFWSLPYVFADLWLHTERDTDTRLSDTTHNVSMIKYLGDRPTQSATGYGIDVRPTTSELQTAVPGTLDHFLIERYLLFAQSADGRLRTGRVHHEPYRYSPVECDVRRQSLTNAIGIELPRESPPDHAVWSPGVDVRVSALQ